MAKEISSVAFQEMVGQSVYLIRNQRVMLDRDLAMLYNIETKNLNKAVKRNLARFPQDFMFQLNKEEFENMKFQFGTSRWGGTRKFPYAFTEHGILMLSSVLNSRRAVNVNIEIMRMFIKMRNIIVEHRELSKKIELLEMRYDSQFRKVFRIIQGVQEDEKKKPQIGFRKNR